MDLFHGFLFSWIIPASEIRPVYTLRYKLYGKQVLFMYNPQLKTFLTAADAGSFDKAAEKCSSRQPR